MPYLVTNTLTFICNFLTAEQEGRKEGRKEKFEHSYATLKN